MYRLQVMDRLIHEEVVAIFMLDNDHNDEEEDDNVDLIETFQI